MEDNDELELDYTDDQELETENYLDTISKESEMQMPSQSTTNFWGQRISEPANPWARQAPIMPGYQSPSPWSSAPQQTSPSWWGQNGVSEKKTINRSKKIIFCDLLDNLMESLQCNGKLGVQPRGIFDIRLKFEVWDKIACFGPEYVFALTNQNLVPDSQQAVVFSTMTEYLMYSLAEYLRLPYQNCQCFTKIGFDLNNPLTKPGTGLIEKALSGIGRYRKEDMLVIGSMSGMANQSDRDKRMAEKFGIDYIDVGELLGIYF